MSCCRDSCESVRTDIKVHERPLGLGSPVSLGGHLQRAKGVLLGPELLLRHGGSSERSGDGNASSRDLGVSARVMMNAKCTHARQGAEGGSLDHVV